MNITDLYLDTHQFEWIDRNQLVIPLEYQRWVMLPGSLTQALRERTDHFSVKVLEQRDIQCQWPLDNQPFDIDCFSRKVVLMNGDEPWVAAHTLVPHSSLQGGLTELTQLENKPLGELLFSSQDIRKDHLQACKTTFGWGRRTCYRFHGQPLLVSEFFLPGLIKHEHQRSAPLY